jgi:hypothetical protein
MAAYTTKEDSKERSLERLVREREVWGTLEMARANKRRLLAAGLL